jgi:putative membrane protein
MWAQASTVDDPWRFVAHPEVWILCVTLLVGYAWLHSRVGPKWVADGEKVVERRYVTFWVSGVAFMWVASDFPIHDLAENYLYWVHMLQHQVFVLIVPPLLLLGTPPWMRRFILTSNKTFEAVARRITAPVAALGFYAIQTAITHWPAAVNASATNAPLHFSLHVIVVASGLVIWFPIVYRNSMFRSVPPIAVCLYIFVISIVPVIPAAFLTFSEGVVYSHYADVPRPFGFSALSDQQAAGAMMKTAGTVYLWCWIVGIFMTWGASEQKADRTKRRERDLLALRPTASTGA